MIVPMYDASIQPSFRCQPNVANIGLTLGQHWANISIQQWQDKVMTILPMLDMQQIATSEI